MKEKGAGAKTCKICVNLAYDMRDGYYCDKYNTWLEQNEQCNAKKCEQCMKENEK